MAGRGDIGEIEIERNQHSIFSLARIKDLGIRISSESFIKNRFYVMTGVAKQRSGILRKIFVQLEPDCHRYG